MEFVAGRMNLQGQCYENAGGLYGDVMHFKFLLGMVFLRGI